MWKHIERKREKEEATPATATAAKTAAKKSTGRIQKISNLIYSFLLFVFRTALFSIVLIVAVCYMRLFFVLFFGWFSFFHSGKRWWKLYLNRVECLNLGDQSSKSHVYTHLHLNRRGDSCCCCGGGGGCLWLRTFFLLLLLLLLLLLVLVGFFPNTVLCQIPSSHPNFAH